MRCYAPETHYVSHEALTAFAWSAPMRDLAAKVGISDVGLRKILRSYGIVTPPQGHWNRVHAGRKVAAPPPSPPRQPGGEGRISVDSRFRGLVEKAPALPVGGPFASAAVPENLEDLRAQELNAIGKVIVPRTLDNPNAGLVRLLKREAQRRLKVETNRWHWDEPLFDTPLDQRKLRFLNGLLNALGRRGHKGEVSHYDGELSAHCVIGDTGLGLAFSISGKYRNEYVRGVRRPAKDLSASTALTLSLKRKLRIDLRTSWQDDDNGKLEAKLADIASDIIVAGEASFRQSLIEEVEQQEEQSRRDEQDRLERLAKLEAKRLEDLKTSGELLRKAEEIRALVAQVKAAATEDGAAISTEELARWERWALDYANRIDPVKSDQILSHIRVPELD